MCLYIHTTCTMKIYVLFTILFWLPLIMTTTKSGHIPKVLTTNCKALDWVWSQLNVTTRRTGMPPGLVRSMTLSLGHCRVMMYTHIKGTTKLFTLLLKNEGWWRCHLKPFSRFSRCSHLSAKGPLICVTHVIYYKVICLAFYPFWWDIIIAEQTGIIWKLPFPFYHGIITGEHPGPFYHGIITGEHPGPFYHGIITGEHPGPFYHDITTGEHSDPFYHGITTGERPGPFHHDIITGERPGPFHHYIITGERPGPFHHNIIIELPAPFYHNIITWELGFSEHGNDTELELWVFSAH